EMKLDRFVDPFGNTAERVLELAWLDCSFATGAKGANPLDAAILAHGCSGEPTSSKLDEIPFDFERRRHSVVVESNGIRKLITKGAPEAVLAVCKTYQIDEAE